MGICDDPLNRQLGSCARGSVDARLRTAPACLFGAIGRLPRTWSTRWPSGEDVIIRPRLAVRNFSTDRITSTSTPHRLWAESSALCAHTIQSINEGSYCLPDMYWIASRQRTPPHCRWLILGGVGVFGELLPVLHVHVHVMYCTLHVVQNIESTRTVFT